MLRIVSKKTDFRRCGVAFTERPVDYPNNKFTPEQIKVLKAEPMLVVVEIPDEPKNETMAEGQIDEQAEQKLDKKPGKK
ncbi:MAG: HI1506-related protein [Smithella sp.]